MVVRTLGFRLRLRLRPDRSLPASCFALRATTEQDDPTGWDSQSSMVKQEIKEIFHVIDSHRILTCHEAEVTAQFRQKLLQVVDNGRLHVLFKVCAFKSEEIEKVGIFEDIFIGRDFSRAFFLFQGNEPFCITGEGDTLKEGAIDFSQEFTGGPALIGCLFKIEIAFYVVLNS